jgi:hypothetical protein
LLPEHEFAAAREHRQVAHAERMQRGKVGRVAPDIGDPVGNLVSRKKLLRPQTAASARLDVQDVARFRRRGAHATAAMTWTSILVAGRYTVDGADIGTPGGSGFGGLYRRKRRYSPRDGRTVTIMPKGSSRRSRP